MRIELIGCTSAGKSTLIAQLRRTVATQPFPVVTGYDYVLQQCGLGWVQPHKVRMALLNTVALIACLLDLGTYWRALRYAQQIIAQLPATVSWGTKLNLARLVMRNLGIDTLLRWFTRRDTQTLVLADEGTLQAVHYLFVHLAAPPDLEAVARWVTLVPLPDLVIHLQQSPAVLIERTVARGHGRIAEPTVAQVTCFIERAVAVFDRLTAHPLLHGQLLAVDAAQASTLDPSAVQRLAVQTMQQVQPAPQRPSAQEGAVIAFIGPEATGKSTLVAATAEWLQTTTAARVRSVHVGKPEGGWLVWPLQRLLPILRRLAPHLRTTRLEQRAQSQPQAPNGLRTQPAGITALVYGVRAVNVAWARYRLLTRMHRRAAAGELIVCDRYPSATVGAMDSPRLERMSEPLRGLPGVGGRIGRWLYNRLVTIEHLCYRQIAPPDVLMRLTVSLEVAMQRNRRRSEADKDDAYLLARRRQAEQTAVAGRYATHLIDTDGTLVDTVAAVRTAVAESLISMQREVHTVEQAEGAPYADVRVRLERGELWER
ncbi:MAG: hypothetical protein KDE19_21205 [Caldilineaceae bacterium]|nr:hypothetical protein [Caldilineaceae bacterium]